MDNKNLEQLLVTKNSKKAVLLLHGLTADTWEMQELAEDLHKEGYTVKNTLIAGHGTSIEDLAKTTWHDWYYTAVKAYLEFKTPESCHLDNQTYIIGQSAGGLLALMIAQHFRPRGVVTINTPIYLMNRLAKLAYITRYFVKSIKSELKEEEIGHYYNRKPLNAIAELMDLMETCKDELHKVKSPLLVIQSTDDPTVNPKSATCILNNAGSSTKSLHMHRSQEHIITRGHEKRQILPEILEFLQNS